MGSDFATPEEKSARERIEWLAAIMSDPVKARILAAAAEAPTAARSPADDDAPAGATVRQIAERIEEPRRKVRYHLSALCSRGIMDSVGKKVRGGFVEQVFAVRQPLLLSRDDMDVLSVTQQKQILLQTLKLIFSDATSALQSGACFRRPEWAAVHLPGEVDERGWHELSEAHERLRLQTETILADSRKRLRTAPESPIAVGSANLLFVAGPPQDGGRPAS